MKHTPGPWKVAGPVGAGIWITDEPANHQIAMVYGPRTNEAAPDNARLIAAAPELLECLKGALLSLEWRVIVMHGPSGINPDPEASRALSQFALKCRAAIAKAEGESPTRGNSRAARDDQSPKDCL